MLEARGLYLALKRPPPFDDERVEPIHTIERLTSLNVHRILILGCCGSGKTWFSQRLAAHTGLPLVHLDDHYWRAGWIRSDETEWRQRVRELAAGPRWIIDGNYAATVEDRLARAEVVFFLDLPTTTCLRAVMQRDVRRLLGDRDSFPAQIRAMDGKPPASAGPLGFYRHVLFFNRDVRPQMVDMFRRASAPVVPFRTKESMLAFFGAGARSGS